MVIFNCAMTKEDGGETVGANAREVVSRLIARQSATSDPRGTANAAALLIRISANLSIFIGKVGCHTLLQRALASARSEHPALKGITIVTQPEIAIAGVLESIQAHGAADTEAGVESVVVSLIVLLTRLVGEDLAVKLVEQGESEPLIQDGPRLYNGK